MELLADYESNAAADRKHHKTGSIPNEDLEQHLLDWINDANSRLIGLSGGLIQERARKFAEQLGLHDFKGSNGWLEKFLKRHNLVCKTMSGERGDLNQETVSDWKARLPTICKDFEPQDIFNMDETGIFFKSGRWTTYCPSDVDCAGGKRAKNRITVALCASMTGEKLKPLVIGRSGKPHCFSRVKVEALPVTYRHKVMDEQMSV